MTKTQPLFMSESAAEKSSVKDNSNEESSSSFGVMQEDYNPSFTSLASCSLLITGNTVGASMVITVT